jgi:hypothetical protein
MRVAVAYGPPLTTGVRRQRAKRVVARSLRLAFVASGEMPDRTKLGHDVFSIHSLTSCVQRED